MEQIDPMEAVPELMKSDNVDPVVACEVWKSLYLSQVKLTNTMIEAYNELKEIYDRVQV